MNRQRKERQQQQRVVFKIFGTVTFVTITMLMQRCENIDKIRLTRTTIQHNEEAGMRDNDLHRQGLQQRTERLAVVGLEKGELFVLKKRLVFALIKAVCSL